MEREKITHIVGRSAAILGLLAAPLFVDALPVAATGVIRIDGVSCGLLDGNGQPVSTQGEVTRIPNGNIIEVCTAQVTPSPEGYALVYNYKNTGYLCGAGGFMTDRWSEVVTPGGQAILRCIDNPSSD